MHILAWSGAGAALRRAQKLPSALAFGDLFPRWFKVVSRYRERCGVCICTVEGLCCRGSVDGRSPLAIPAQQAER